MAVTDSVADVQTALAPMIADGSLPGYAAGVSIDGEGAVLADGHPALGAPEPIRADAIFRIASLTKLVGAALALNLAADGVISLEAEVARWLPELTEPRVLTAPDAALDDNRPLPRPILVGDLLTFTCGFGLVLTPGPLRDALREEGLSPGPFAPPFSHDEFMARLGGLPLALAPGAGWLYHTGLDALGVLLARAAAQPLRELLAERITGPLRMKDTGFWTDQVDRLTTAYTPAGDALEILDLPRGRFARRPRFEALGSGLLSTVPDFLGFMEMLADDGGSVLRPADVELMSSNRLSDAERASAETFLGPGRSWGLGCEVVLGRGETAVGAGSFGWMGGTGTTAYVDPQRGLCGVLFTQRALETSRPPRAAVAFWDAVYRSL